MRAICVASAALLGIGALSSCAPAAVANTDGTGPAFGISVTPSSVAAGGQVTLRVDRDAGGCRGTATVTSGVFDTVHIRPGHSSATAVVDRDARAGATYRVTFACDGLSGSTDLTITGGGATHRPDHRPDHQPKQEHVVPKQEHVVPKQEHVVPKHGVHAGGGGTLAGFDLQEIGLGLALVTGSVGVAYHLSRRRSGEDGA
ncbi:hypothetical protein [Streptomyces sp. NPDC057877]|uniref:hypothetical protein n=1 Tax=Streptomyces sp. NPDC057877 TaxID=3346269 RepID=UPI00367BD965